MLNRITSLLFAGLLTCIALGGCDRNAGDASAASGVRKTIEDRFAIKVGGHTVAMQVAALPDEMQKGLMYRKSMGEDEGMIFIFERPQQMSFWMRHTEIPLEIGFFDSTGELKEIYDMYPHDENAVRSRSKGLQIALEMNQGWYSRNGVKPAARLDLAALTEALRARGRNPEELGLIVSSPGK